MSSSVPWRKSGLANAVKRRRIEPDYADRDYRKWLCEQYADGTLSAKRTCLGAWNLGPLAKDAGVEDLAKGPSAQSGSYAKHLGKALQLDQFVEDAIFWHKIPQHCKKERRRKMMPHPFLCPHRQANDFASSCGTSDSKFLDLPIHQNLELIKTLKEQGPFSIVLGRLYVDGIDTGGKSRKVAKKVYAFMWTPIQSTRELNARRLITVLMDIRSCRCGCVGRSSTQAIWRGRLLPL